MAHDFVRVLGVDADAAVVRKAARKSAREISLARIRPEEERRGRGHSRLFRIVVAGQDAHIRTRNTHQACDECFKTAQESVFRQPIDGNAAHS